MVAQTARHDFHFVHSIWITLLTALVFGALFALCWVTAAYGKSAAAAAIAGLLTARPISSIDALGEGLLWAMAIGAAIGAAIALSQYLLGRGNQSTPK